MKDERNDGDGARGGGDERIHRYHDGELSEPERLEVERALASDEEARLKRDALAELSSLLRSSSDAATEGFSAWPLLEQRIAESKVTAIATHRRRRRGAILAGVSSVAAAAAVLAVLFSPRAGGLSNNCDITEVEATGADVTVLKFPDEAKDSATTVVWMHEQPEEE